MNKTLNNNEINRLKEENFRLRNALDELSILNEIALSINSTLSLEKILESIVQKCTKHLKVQQVAVLLLDEKTDTKPFQTMVRGCDTTSNVLPYRLDIQLTGWMLKNKTILLINDFENDDRFNKISDTPLSIHSLLSVPMFSRNRMIGLIVLFNKKEDIGFSKDDQRLLSILASQASQVIENARLLEEEQKLLKVQQELRVAYDIQSNLLPSEAPELEGYDIYGKSIPARQVGGDYFDFIPIDDQHMAFCLGDISGKGIPAALLMSNLQATVRGQTLAKASVVECLERSNEMLVHNTPPEKFSTFFYGILDSKSHKIVYGNAGHNYPFLFPEEKEFRLLDIGDTVLGFIEESTYQEQIFHIEHGEIFVLYSDGITEAINEVEEEFGESGLISVINDNKSASSKEITEKIIHAVQKHAGSCVQFDDMTIVIIRRIKKA